jgi:hypothetical protein
MTRECKTLKESISAVLAVDHKWALAAMAYKQLKDGNPELLTDEEISMSGYRDYLEQVTSITFNGQPLPTIKPAMDFVSFRVVFAYGIERVTNNSLAPGGNMTLYGHAGYEILRMGYAAMIASGLDSGAMEATFKTYIKADDGILKAINTGDSESAIELFPIRTSSYIQLEQDYENLIEVLSS